MEEEKGHNDNSASIEEVEVKVEAELGKWVAGLGGNIDPRNPVKL